MGTYFEEEREKTQWESGQAVLHSESVKPQEHKEGQRENDRNLETYRVQNSYGTLRYLKKDKKRGETREGFAVEAIEAPNTRIHTDAEKHLNRKSIKKVKQNDKQTLYASELPLRDQALFLDMRGGKKSIDMIQYMKALVQEQGHQTLKDAFGFLDQEEERAELEALKEKRNTPEEKDFATLEDLISQKEHKLEDNKRIDTLNSRLRRKEALERQLRNELQVMLDQRGREEVLEAQKDRMQNETETSDTKQNTMQNTGKKSDSPRRRFLADTEVSETDGTVLGADEEDSETDDAVSRTGDSSDTDEDGMPQDTVL